MLILIPTLVYKAKRVRKYALHNMNASMYTYDNQKSAMVYLLGKH